MPILVAQHDADTPLGDIEAPLTAAGHTFERWVVSDGGQPDRPIEHYDGMIVLGSIVNPDQDDEYAWVAPERELMREALERGLPMLGLCFGSQMLAQAAGGRAFKASEPEIGWIEISKLPAAAGDPLLGDLPDSFVSFEWHHCTFEIPEAAVLLARTPGYQQAFRVGEHAWGCQFHIEASGELLYEWVDGGHDELRVHDVDPDAFKAEIAAQTPRHIELAHRLGAGFAGVVSRYVERRAAAAPVA